MTTVDRKGTFKVEYLLQIEKDVQKKWDEQKIFEIDAPQNPDRLPDEKFFVTFPYPYMNGKLHLGHCFSLSKCEFAVRYNRLKGKKALFPFAFHCTGMPIKACADKLQREMDTYGYPPKFPTEIIEEKNGVIDDDEIVNKAKGKKSKATAKSGGAKYQWEIMRSLGLTDDEIRNFSNTSHWLDYFPPIAMKDLRSFGIHVDWRRTFITTNANPYYDSFIRWQFRRLKSKNKIKYGKRYTIYSPRDKQPCMDHDRASGEGVSPQEYTLIKMKILKPYKGKLKRFEDKVVYLVAGTLRPETMYGQTNCWVHPDLNYIAYVVKSGDIFISTLRSAKNMLYQELLEDSTELNILETFTGQDILGLGIKAPLSFNEIIYTLPMLTIKENKGTGIVTSVPSDSPDDYAAFMDLKRKAPLREKYDISDHMVIPFELIPIIEVPTFGGLSAKVACERLKIQSQNDREKLQEAKEMVYLKGFYDGIMLVGEFRGKMIKDIKKLLQKKLIDSNEAVLYYEPEKQVMSRSGEECVVALCDQWYLDYGELSWKKDASIALKNMNTFHEEVRKNFVFCLDWLHEYACSRKYGLGTNLPWDEQWLIESLSDSTIYMAYYTVAHILQNGSFCGDGSTSIKPEDLTDSVWNYVFLKAPFPTNSKIKKDILEKMRNEFNYWYPVDLRCSGKDLIQNHLTFFIYNHVAIWSKNQDLWPRAIRANGHLLLNSAKMSKSEGNFLTLTDAVKKFSADGMRLCLADSGDSIEDANFAETVAEAGILRLFTFIEWTKEMIADKSNLRTGPVDGFHDRVFISEMNMRAKETDENYKNMLFKEALRTGFFELQTSRDSYRERTACENGMHRDLIFQFIELQALLLSPICPHVAEFVYGLLGKSGSIVNANWPTIGVIDDTLLQSSVYLEEAAHSFRIQKKNYNTQSSKGKKGGKTVANSTVELPNEATIWIAKSYPPWQLTIIETIVKMYKEQGNVLPDNKTLSSIFASKPDLKRHMKKVMPFVQCIKEKIQNVGEDAVRLTLSFDEKQVLEASQSYLKNTLEIKNIIWKFSNCEDAPNTVKEDCCPGNPHITFSINSSSAITLKLINPHPRNSLFSLDVDIQQVNTVENIAQLILKRYPDIKSKNNIQIWRYLDPEMGPRKMPNGELNNMEIVPHPLKLRIDENKRVMLELENGDIKYVGNVLIYVVTS